jgi:hypothetical protein
MKFEENQNYVDRKGRQYTFVRKSSGVTVFADTTGKQTCRNDKGWYRWDDKETDEDIIGVAE